MGIVRMGPPEEFVLPIAQHLRLNSFIETGTFEGSTARWASRHFQRVVTIEAAPMMHLKAKSHLSQLGNVECVCGDSATEIPRMAATAPPSVFWLDAHYCGEGTAGEENECPLLAELEALAPVADRHLLLIDDARMFLAPPPKPHKAECWPSIDTIIDALRRVHPVHIVVFDDIIAAIPRSARNVAIDVLRRRRT